MRLSRNQPDTKLIDSKPGDLKHIRYIAIAPAGLPQYELAASATRLHPAWPCFSDPLGLVHKGEQPVGYRRCGRLDCSLGLGN